MWKLRFLAHAAFLMPWASHLRAEESKGESGPYGVLYALDHDTYEIQSSGRSSYTQELNLLMETKEGLSTLNDPIIGWIPLREQCTGFTAEVIKEGVVTPVPQHLIFEQPGGLGFLTGGLLTSKTVTVVAPGVSVGDTLHVRAHFETSPHELPDDVSIGYEQAWTYKKTIADVSWPVSLSMRWAAPSDAEVHQEGEVMHLHWEGGPFPFEVPVSNALPVMNRRPRIVVSPYRSWEDLGARVRVLVEKWLASAAASPTVQQWPLSGPLEEREREIRRSLQDSLGIKQGPVFLRLSNVWRSPEEILQSKQALPIEAALLYTALLRQSGIQASLALYNSDVVEPGEQPFVGYFNAPAVLWGDGTYALFNGGKIPVGIQPTGLPVLILREHPEWTKFPTFDLSKSACISRHQIEILAEGGVRGTVHTHYTGYPLSLVNSILGSLEEVVGTEVSLSGLVGGGTSKVQLEPDSDDQGVRVSYSWASKSALLFTSQNTTVQEKEGHPPPGGLIFPDLAPSRLPNTANVFYGAPGEAPTDLLNLPSNLVQELDVMLPEGYVWSGDPLHQQLSFDIGSLTISQVPQGRLLKRCVDMKMPEAIIPKASFERFQHLVDEFCRASNRCARVEIVR